MRCVFFAAILALVPLPLLAQDAERDGTEAAKTGFFSWLSNIFSPPAYNPDTATLIDAPRILREDNAREEAKERAYWEKRRARDEKMLGERAKAEADARLLAARERGEAIATALEPRQRAATAGEQIPPEETRGARDEATEDLPPSNVLEELADKVADAAESAGQQLNDAAQGIASKFESTFIGTPPDTGPKLSSVILALVAIFLVPSAAVILLVLAVISMRGGHRLQSAVLGAAGCAIGLLGVAAAQPAPDESALMAELQSECEEAAVRISGYVDEATADGVVVDNVSGAASDEHGSVVIITAKKDARAGQEWKSLVYPVGERRALNAYGMLQPMPAYADQLETAVAIRAEAERRLRESWWQSLARYLRESLGTEPQRLITLK